MILPDARVWKKSFDFGERKNVCKAPPTQILELGGKKKKKFTRTYLLVRSCKFFWTPRARWLGRFYANMRSEVREKWK